MIDTIRWRILVVALAGWVNRHQLEVIDYLREGTDRGRRVASLQPFDASAIGPPLRNREIAIAKRSKVPVDSAVYQSELREDQLALSGEVDVVAETAFTCSLEQAQQRRPFRSPCLASDDDDDAAMALRLSQLEEIVAVAGGQRQSCSAANARTAASVASSGRTSRSRRTSWFSSRSRYVRSSSTS